MKFPTVFPNLRMKNEMMILLVLPISILMYLLTTMVMLEYRNLKEISTFRDLAEFEEKSDALLTPFQKERGISVEYVKARGGQFAAQLKTGRMETDKAISDFKNYPKTLQTDELGEDFASRLEESMAVLEKLDSLRSGIYRFD